MAKVTNERIGQYLKTALQVLVENGGSARSRLVVDEVGKQLNLTDYERQVRDSVEAGTQYIISGAGLPLRLPEYVGKADVALIPIVSSPRVVDLLCRRWKRHGRLPDAIVLEGPKSGGHQGFTYEQCLDPAYQLEVLTPPVLKACKSWGNIPLIVAGGVWDRRDVDRYLDMGVAAVQMAT